MATGGNNFNYLSKFYLPSFLSLSLFRFPFTPSLLFLSFFSVPFLMEVRLLIKCSLKNKVTFSMRVCGSIRHLHECTNFEDTSRFRITDPETKFFQRADSKDLAI